MTLSIWDFVASFGIILFGYIFSVFILMIEYFYTVCSKHFCKTKKKVETGEVAGTLDLRRSKSAISTNFLHLMKVDFDMSLAHESCGN